MRVDVLDWHSISESFHQGDRADYVVVQKGAEQATAGGWHSVALAEAPVEIIDGDRGKNYPKQDDFLEDGVCLFLNAGNVTAGGFNFTSCAFISSDREQRLGKGKLARHDVVLTTRGTVGNSAHYSDDVPYEHLRINSGMVILRASDLEIDSRFLYLVTRSQHFRSQVKALSTGSAQPQLPIRDIEKINIPLPPLAEQRAIAHVLGTLDDKIELNRRMNETLEEMARALFKSWFVDFEPVRAKMEGRWRRGEFLPGLPADLYDLFPDRLVDSELGEVPEGWGLRAFGTLLDDVIGGDWGKETPDVDHTEPVSIIRGTDLSALAEGGSGSVPLRFTTKKKAERRMLKHGDIIIEVSGGSPTQSTGRSLMMTRDVLHRFPGIVVCASFCRRFRPNSWRDGLLASRHLDFLHSIGKMWDYQLQSTGIANFQTTRFLKEEMAIWPDESLLTKFAEIVDPVARRKARNENMTLAALRDALLPRLVSGEVGVGGLNKL